MSDDELTRARARLAEVEAKLEQGGEGRDYYERVVALWKQYIERLEAKANEAI